MHKRLKDFGYFVIGIILCFVLFQLIAFIINDNYIFPNPFEILNRFFYLFSEGKTYIEILKSLLHLLIAIVISFVLGSILGVFSTNSIVEKILRPTMRLFKSLPIIALIVILLLLAKNAYIPIIAATLILTPIFYDGIREGILAIDHTLMDVWRLDSNFNIKVFIRVYIPLTASTLKASFSAATGLGIKAIVAGEYLASVSDTLGKSLNNALAYSDFIDLYAYSLLMVLLVIIVEAIPIGLDYLIKRIYR